MCRKGLAGFGVQQAMNQVTHQQPSAEAQSNLLDELVLGSARGGKAGVNREPLVVSVSRVLTESDLPAISNPPPVGGQVALVKDLRHSHHKMAQLIAEGKAGTEIHLLTGYSQSYISSIQGDPAFAELVSYYSEQRATIFLDANERLKLLGIDATEKLHDKLNDPSQTWSARELMELVDMALIKPGQIKAAQGGSAPGNNLSLEVKFVGAQPAATPVTIEAQFSEVEPKP